LDDLESLFRASEVGIGVIEMIRDASGKAVDYRFVRINDAVSRLMGYQNAEGRTVLEVSPDLDPKWIQAFDRVARDGAPMHVENHAPFGPWFDVRAFRIGEKDSNRLGLIFADITARKETEAALTESERRLSMAMDAGRLAVWEVDLASATVTPSAALNQLYGFELDAVPSLADYQSRYAPGENERLQLLGADLMAGHIPHLETEVRHVIPVLGERWLLLRAHLEGTPARRIIGVAVDVTASKQAALQNALLRRELEHRIKNILSMVTAIAAQTFRGSSEQGRVQDFNGRIRALANAQSLATGDGWQETDMETTMRAALLPFEKTRITLIGSRVPITPKMALSLALATNELATNSVKYGSLGVPGGHVNVSWKVVGGALTWVWQEVGGPQVLAPPKRKGFGSVLIERVLAEDFAGQVDVRYDGGLLCKLTAPEPRAGA